MPGISAALLAEVRGYLLPGRGQTPREVWEAMGGIAGCWAPATVKNALRELHRQGRAGRSKKSIPQGFVWLYYLE